MRLTGRRAHATVAIALVCVALGVAALLAGGKASQPPSQSRSTATRRSSAASTRHLAQPVGTAPSESAQMVCATEAQRDVASVLGTTTPAPVSPTWIDDVYACRYIYSDGAIALSVKELSNSSQTTAYFAALRALLGQREHLKGLGQGAFLTPNSAVVARKDYKVLVVDTTGLPEHFGDPAMPRSQVAIDVAVTILGCWTGA